MNKRGKTFLNHDYPCLRPDSLLILTKKCNTGTDNKTDPTSSRTQTCSLKKNMEMKTIPVKTI